MPYIYPKSKEEEKAERLLTSKGWSVKEPQCPLCHGRGYVGKSDFGGSGAVGWGSSWSENCPNGCPRPTMYFNTNAGVYP